MDLMRRLVLLRHGDSGWDGDPPSDHARTLTALGVAQARAAAEALVQRGWRPQRILSSNARRALDTAAEVGAVAGVAVEPQAVIYDGGVGVLQSCIAALPDDVEVVVVVGHNPALSAASSLWGQAAVSLATGCAALLEKPAARWSDAVAAPGWRLVDVVTPDT